MVKSVVSVPGAVRFSVIRSTNSGLIKKNGAVLKSGAGPKGYKSKSKVSSVRVGRSSATFQL